MQRLMCVLCRDRTVTKTVDKDGRFTIDLPDGIADPPVSQRPMTPAELDVQQLRDIAARVAYRGGDWQLHVYQGVHHGPHLRITADVPDAYTAGATCPLDIHVIIPPMESERQFVRFLLWRIVQAETHEAREHFVVDGKRPYNPHAPQAERDLA